MAILTRLLFLSFLTTSTFHSIQAGDDHGHGGHGHEHEHGDHEAMMYCTTECTTENADDPCTNGKAQQSTCVNGDFLDMVGIFGYNETEGGQRFVGCSESICESACMGVNMTKPMEVVIGSNGIKTFCFPNRDTGMFMMEDLAEMSAISRGCSGAHQMGEMYMHGSMHTSCDDSYEMMGIPFGKDESSSSRFHLSVVTWASTLSLLVVSLVL